MQDLFDVDLDYVCIQLPSELKRAHPVRKAGHDPRFLRPEHELVDRALRLDRVGAIGHADLEIAQQLGSQVGVDEDLLGRVAFARAATADPHRQDRGEEPPEPRAELHSLAGQSWLAIGRQDRYPIDELAEEFATLRRSNVLFFKDYDALIRTRGPKPRGNF